MARRENQIAADKNAGPSPKRRVVVVVCADPNLSDRAVRPDTETVVNLMIKVALAVTGFEFAENFCVLGFAAVCGRVLLSLGSSPAGAARRLMALGDFEAAAFDALFDYRWFYAALRFSGETLTLDFRRAALILVGGIFRILRSIVWGRVDLI